MFAFTAGVSVLACLLFGLVPALQGDRAVAGDTRCAPAHAA